MNVLGLSIPTYTKEEILQQVREWLQKKDGQYCIYTPNPEMLVDAYRDHRFLHILQAADMLLCDGKGLELVGKGELHRVTGIDFIDTLCALARETQATVYLLGSGNKTTIEQAKQTLQVRFPHLRIVGTHPGPQLQYTKDTTDQMYKIQSSDHEDMLGDIIQAAPDILLVGFGHGKQEWWIHTFLRELPSVCIAMGVGGSFDIISQNIRRAPLWVRNMGCEWIWRCIRQPWRISRIWKATVVFLFLVFRNSQKHN